MLIKQTYHENAIQMVSCAIFHLEQVSSQNKPNVYANISKGIHILSYLPFGQIWYGDETFWESAKLS